MVAIADSLTFKQIRIIHTLSFILERLIVCKSYIISWQNEIWRKQIRSIIKSYSKLN